jgi:hypothetical protein
MESAARLRSLYHVQAGLQQAPFFEIHTGAFSLIAIDTGIEKQVDAKQFEWIKAAIERSKGTFTMAIIGHPFYAAGQSQIGEGSFKAVHDLLKSNGVRVLLAGDTHDFEITATPARTISWTAGWRILSIGTSLDWPARPALGDYAFYPRTDAVSTKLDQETPPWKWPAWWWIRHNGAWPFSVEALSAVFDFNRAPFFQSFVEVGSSARASGGVCDIWRRWTAVVARPPDRRRGDPGRPIRGRSRGDRGAVRTLIPIFLLTLPCDRHILSNRKINGRFVPP